MMVKIILFVLWQNTVLFSIVSGCIASPRESLSMRIREKTLTVNSNLTVDLNISIPTPDFKTVLKLDGLNVQKSSFTNVTRPREVEMTTLLKKPGNIDVNLEVKWKGKSFRLLDTVQVYKFLTEKNIVINVTEIVVLPPGNASLVLKLVDDEHLPTNVSGKVDWNDGSPISEIDFTNETLSKSSKEASLTIYHQYLEKGKYKIEINLANAVSQVKKSVEVRVVEKLTIEELHISYSKETLETERKSKEFIFLLNKHLKISSKLLKGDKPITMYLEINGEIIETKNMAITYVFTKAGTCKLFMWVKGLAGISNKVSKEIEIREALTSEFIKVQIDDSVIENPPGKLDLSIGIVNQNYSTGQISGNISWSRTENQIFDLSFNEMDKNGMLTQSFSHIYSSPGVNQIVVQFLNKVSEYFARFNVTVIEKMVIEGIDITSSTWKKGQKNEHRIFRNKDPLLFDLKTIKGRPDSFKLSIGDREVVSRKLPITFRFDNAGEYFVKIVALKLNKTSNIVAESLFIEQPLKLENIHIDAPEFVVTPRDETVLNVSIVAEDELPTHVRGHVIWEEGVKESLDWSKETPPGLKIFKRSLKHTYSTPGIHTARFLLRNNASNVVKLKDVVTIAELVVMNLKINNLSLSDNETTNYFPSRHLLKFTAEVQSGNAKKYWLQVEDKESYSSVELPIDYTFQKPGKYKIKFWATGKAGKSNVLVKTADIQKELFSKHVQVMDFPSQPVGHTGNVKFKVTLLETYDVTSNVFIVIDWGDGNNEKHLLFNPGKSGLRFEKPKNTFEHKYSNSGNYTLNLMVKNDVSELTTDISIEVVGRISLSGISIKSVDASKLPVDSGCQNSFLVDSELEVTALKYNGHIIQWRFTSTSEELENEIGRFLYSFKELGWHTINLTAVGLENDTVVTSRKIFIAEEVTDLAMWAYPSKTRANSPVVFFIRGSYVTASCLTVNFGDDTKSEILCDPVSCDQNQRLQADSSIPTTPDLILRHTFPNGGQFTVTIELLGPVNSLKRKLDIVVGDESFCEAVHLSIDNKTTRATPKQIQRKKLIKIESKLSTLKCKQKIKWKTRWTLNIIKDQQNEVLSSKASVKLPISKEIKINNAVLVLSPNVLPYGLYYFSVKYSIYNSITDEHLVDIYDVTAVEIVKSSLVANVVQGSSTYMLKGNDQILKLCASCHSFDPDQVFEISGFRWWCIRSGEDWNSSNLLSFPSKYGHNGKEDLGGCFGNGPGVFPVAEGKLTFSTSLFYKIPGNYSIKVEVQSEDGRKSNKTMDVEIVVGNPPELESNCVPPETCFYFDGIVYVNPIKMILVTSCIQTKFSDDQNAVSGELGEDSCGFPPVHYEWQMKGVRDTGDTESLDLNGYAIGMNRYRFALLETFWESELGSFPEYEIVVYGKREGEKVRGKTMLTIRLNKPPHGGKCFISRENNLQIKALVQGVEVNCSDWKDPEGRGIERYKFSVMLNSSEKTPLWAGKDFPALLYFPYGDFELLAEITDAQNAVTEYMVSDISTVLPSMEEYDSYQASGMLNEAVQSEDLSKVNMLLAAEKSLNRLMTADVPSDETDKNSALVNSVDNFPATNMDEILQATSILSVVAYPLPDEDQDAAIESLRSLSKTTEKQVSSPKVQKEFVASSLGTVASLLKGVNEDENEVDDTKTAKKGQKVESMMEVIESSQKGILNSSVVGEDTNLIRSEGTVTMGVGFFDASELEGKSIDVDGALYVFPHYCDLLSFERNCLENKSISVGLKMANWVNQVYNFGGGRDLLSKESATVQLSLVDQSMKTIPVKNSTSDIVIYIPRRSSDIPSPEFIVPEMIDNQRFMSHTIPVPQPRLGVNIFFKPENDTEYGQWLFTWSEIPTYNATNRSTFSLDDFEFFDDIGYYGLFISSEEVGDAIGNRFLGIAMKNSEPIEIKVKDYNYVYDVYSDYEFYGSPNTSIIFEPQSTEDDLPPIQEVFTSNYSLMTFVSSCLFFKTREKIWSSEGCKVIAANMSVTVCSCNHLTSFGSGLIVAPNAIDFSYVFANADFSENLTIYLTLIVMVSIYLIGVVYARYMDIQDRKKVGAHPLPDNHPEDKYLYDIYVNTGFYPDAGTKSNVNFLITGEYEDSGVRELNSNMNDLLKRGSCCQFVMATERSLGTLHYLRIWHDNSGKGSKASWYFTHMIVRDIQTGEEFQFICNQWLAVEEEDGHIERGVSAATEKQKRDFSHVFSKTVERNLSDDHLWLSIFLRPVRSRFTRLERLSSVMALVFLSMLVNAMFYETVPENSGEGGLNVGPFSLSPQAMSVGFMTNLIIFPPSFLIVFFFRKSRLRNKKPCRIKKALETQRSKGNVLKDAENTVSNQDESTSQSGVSLTSSTKSKKMEIKKRKKFLLPWWCRIIAWILVVVAIGSSVFFLWAYGITFGDEKVQKWLSSLIVSIFSSMFITQPVKIYFMAAILSLIFKKPLNESDDYDDDEELMELEIDEEFLFETKSTTSCHKKKEYKGSSLDDFALKRARLKREQEVAMNSLIFEILLYLTFLSVILAISYGSRDPSIIYMKNHFSNLLITSKSQNDISFKEMKSKKDIWQWVREILVPTILDEELYNGVNIYDSNITEKLDGSLVDRVSYLLGTAVLRQIRVQPDNCVLHPYVEEMFSECNGYANFYDEEEKDFGKAWNNSPTGRPRPYYTYHSPLSIQGIPFSGTYDTYGGGGYLIHLKRRKSLALAQIADLEKTDWIDKYTRALFTEISIYNAQVNLFGVMMCVVEFLPGGGIYSSFKFYGLNLYRYHSGSGIFMLVSELAFVIFTISFLRKEHRLWKKEGKAYFKSKWNWMEVVTIFLSVTTVVFYIIKSLYGLYVIDKLTSTKGKRFVRMQSLAVLDETLTYIIGFLLFIATLKLLKILRFNKKIGFLSETLKAASSDILGFAVLFTVTLVSFVTIFHIEAITASVEFSTFIRAAETSIFEITKKFPEVTRVSPILGPLFYFVFAFIMYWIVLQVLIAIICNTFTRIKNDLASQPNDYEVVDYIITKFVKFLRSLKIHRGKIAVYDKLDETEKIYLQVNSSLEELIAKLDNFKLKY